MSIVNLGLQYVGLAHKEIHEDCLEKMVAKPGSLKEIRSLAEEELGFRDSVVDLMESACQDSTNSDFAQALKHSLLYMHQSKNWNSSHMHYT